MQGGQEAPAQQKGTIKLHSLIPKYCKLDGPRKIVPQDVTEVRLGGGGVGVEECFKAHYYACLI